MTLTKEQLKCIMPKCGEVLDELFPHLTKAMREGNIDTPLRIAHFIAQIAHESNEMRSLEENLNYSAKGLLATFPKYFTEESAKEYQRNPQAIGNHVYANRMGNGNEGSGDGYTYRGRGLIQLSGRELYWKYSNYGCGFDMIKQPYNLTKPLWATHSAVWFWNLRGLSELADKDDVKAIRKRINGGTNGLQSVEAYLNKAKEVLGI